MARTSFIITREDLYRRVWEVPFNQLVEEYGTTYGHLRRIAEEMDVPRPGSGYWKKRAFGKAGEQTPLPDPRSGCPLSRRIVRVDTTEEGRNDRSDRFRAYEAALGKLSVPQRLVRPHPLVAAWIAARRRHERHFPRQNTAAPSLYPPSDTDERRHRILQALLPALERQGAKITGGVDEGPISAQFRGATIEFRLREKLKQLRLPLTAEELRRPWASPSSYHIELHPTGLLSFKIETYTRSSWRAWEDDRGGVLEEKVTEIAVALLMARDSVIEAAQEEQAWEAQRVEREQRRIAAVAVREREEARWNTFVAMARRFEEVEYLRAFLRRLEASHLASDQMFGDRTVVEWLDWVRERIESFDPFSRGAAAAFEALQRAG